MSARILRIVNEKGLHARASAKFVEVVEDHDAQAQVTKDGMTVSGDSIMGLLMLAAGPAQAMAPIRDHLDTGRAGERDHAYPLMRCGALYMSSLKASDDVPPEKAEMLYMPPNLAGKYMPLTSVNRVNPKP